jgi:hypothetical protein
VDGLTFEEIGFYDSLWARMYDHGGPLKHDEAALAHRLHCDVRVFRRLLTALVNKGKLIVKDGLITNSRVMRELSKREKIGRTSVPTSAELRHASSPEVTRKTQQKQRPSQKPLGRVPDSPSKEEIHPASAESGQPARAQELAPRFGVTIAKDWKPDAATEQFAMLRCLTPERMHDEAAVFLNKHLGDGTTAHDWHAKFRAWLARCKQFDRKDHANGRAAQAPQRGGTAEIIAGLAGAFADCIDDGREPPTSH